jgi:opacity protein-like surface antigen
MKRLARLATVAVVAAAALGIAAAPASAAQIPCGSPTFVKLYLTGGAQICFYQLGRNEFNKVGVYRVDTGSYGGNLIGPNGVRIDFQPHSTRHFTPFNPNFVNLTRVELPA